RALESHADSVHDDGNALAQRFADFTIVYGNCLGHTFNQVAALDLHCEWFVEWISRADFDLDLFGGAFADQQVVLAFEVVGDGLVHLIAGHGDGTGIDDAGKRDDSDVGGAAADVDNHVSRRFGDGKPGADGCHHGLFDEVDFASFGAIGGVFNRALFHLGNLRRYPDHDARMHQHLAVVRLLDEVVQHLLGDLEVVDNAVFHRLDSDDGRLVDHDALAASVHQRVRRPQVDSKIAGESAEQRAHVAESRTAAMETVG